MPSDCIALFSNTFHGIFIWFGDILACYAVVGFIAVLIINQSTKTINGILIGCAILSVLFGVTLSATGSSFGSDPELNTIMKFFSAENELRVFQQGTYFEQLLLRSVIFILAGISYLFLLPCFLGLFLMGTRLAQIGAIQSPDQHLPLLKKLIGFGLGLGLPLNSLIFFANTPESRFMLQSLIELIFGPILAIGLFACFLLLAHRISNRQIALPLVKIGRVSLSVYLLQSLLCTFYFYSWGLKRFGTHSLQELFLVVFGVWILCGCFAWAWLRKFDIGPVEWLWRSWDGKYKLPWKTPAPPPVQGN